MPAPTDGPAMTAAEYARAVDGGSFSWTDLASCAFAADPTIVQSIRRRPELMNTHATGRRVDDVAAVVLLLIAPAVACVLTALGAANASAFGYYAAGAAVLLFATIAYVLLGWRKRTPSVGREERFAWSAAFFGVVGAVIAAVASVAGDETALNWARPLAGLFIAVTVVAVAWAFAVRRRLRTMRDDQPVTTSYAVLGELRAMDAGQRAAAADDLRDAVAILDERGIIHGQERPEIIGQLTQPQ